MSFVIGAITLPRLPEIITFTPGADLRTFVQPGALPLIISLGNKVDVLVIEGRLQAAGQTLANLTTNYITPLRALVHTEVTIQLLGETYHNQDFIFEKPIFDRRPGWSRAYYYKMTFWRGSAHEVI